MLGISPTIFSGVNKKQQSIIIKAAFFAVIGLTNLVNRLFFMLSAIIGVSTFPGQKAVNVTPVPLYSRLSASVKPTSANFEAE
jgi:hypothetical protein